MFAGTGSCPTTFAFTVASVSVVSFIILISFALYVTIKKGITRMLLYITVSLTRLSNIITKMAILFVQFEFYSEGLKCPLSQFAADLMLGRIVDLLEGREDLQKDLDRLG